MNLWILIVIRMANRCRFHLLDRSIFVVASSDPIGGNRQCHHRQCNCVMIYKFVDFSPLLAETAAISVKICGQFRIIAKQQQQRKNIINLINNLSWKCFQTLFDSRSHEADWFFDMVAQWALLHFSTASVSSCPWKVK